LQAVWGSEYGDEADYVWTFVQRIRRKLEPDRHHPRYVLTEAGVGYWMPAPEPSEATASAPAPEPVEAETSVAAADEGIEENYRGVILTRLLVAGVALPLVHIAALTLGRGRDPVLGVTVGSADKHAGHHSIDRKHYAVVRLLDRVRPVPGDVRLG